jgi:acylphosphatase
LPGLNEQRLNEQGLNEQGLNESGLNEPGLTRTHVWVAGRVQGVWFRDACAREAAAHDVQGWVHNLADGRVEAVFEGTEAAVDALVEWCRAGPPRARVDGVEVREEPAVGETGFRIA